MCSWSMIEYGSIHILITRANAKRMAIIIIIIIIIIIYGLYAGYLKLYT